MPLARSGCRQSYLPKNAVLVASLLCAIGFLSACHSKNRSPEGAAAQAPAFPIGETMWVSANGLPLKATIYKSAKLSPHPALIVVLHGDLLEARIPPSYHYEFARRVANQMDDVVVVALLRPGYIDGVGDQSAGKRGLATGDNYTPEVVEAIGQTVDALKARFLPAATIIAGHSGGATISADLLGREPRKVDAALLVSCPCDVPAWRHHMVKEQFSHIGPLSLLFLLPVKSLSPLDLAADVPMATRVRMIVGSEDPTAPPKFTQEYAEALRKRGIDVTVTLASGLGHNILLEPVVLEQLNKLVAAVKGSLRAESRL